MKKTNATKLLSLCLCIVLIAAMALFSGCQDNKYSTITLTDGETYGVGATEFAFSVIDLSGNETKVTVKTDKATVGEALLDAEIIAGDASEFGLYVKSVNGKTLDYDADKAYWAFYVDGGYASSGVDTTSIEAGKTYTFKAEKA